MLIRLDKLLADSGFGTRNEVKKLLKDGAVTVDGSLVRDGSMKVDKEASAVTCRGENVTFNEYEYYLLYKPAGLISASRDSREKTVVELIKSRKRRDLFPVGRLDRDTEGLLLITNDGQLSHRLLSPGKHVDKVYLALVSGIIPENAVELFSNGIDIGDDALTRSAELRIFSSPEETGDERIIEKAGELTLLSKETDSFSDIPDYQSEEDSQSGEDSKPEEDYCSEEDSQLGEDSKPEEDYCSEVDSKSGEDCQSEGDYRSGTAAQPEADSRKKREQITAVRITLTEGRYHEIKRMFEAVGCQVEYLKRISMGSLTLAKDMKPGDYREMKREAVYDIFG